MGLKNIVYLKPITNLSDGRFAAASGCTFTGFVCDPILPDSIPLEQIIQITGWMSGPESVAIFARAIPDLINDTCERLQITTAELPFSESIDYSLFKQSLIIRVPISIVANNQFDPREFAENTVFLFEKDENCLLFSDLQSQHALLHTVRFLQENYPVLLNFDWNQDAILALQKLLPNVGLVLHGGMEEKPGIRAFDELTDLINLLED